MIKNLFVLVLFVGAVLYYVDVITPSSDFAVPEMLSVKQAPGVIQDFEFTDLFKSNVPTAGLAKPGYYTIVEGYTDSCNICKRLEADFVPFLEKRPDVVIRRVRFPEDGLEQSFSGQTALEMNRQIVEFAERSAQYHFNRVRKIGNEYEISTCGTPHIEIYGPDRRLIVTDKCGDRNLKSGLMFLRAWMGTQPS